MNDYTKGVYQVIYDCQKISEIRRDIYKKLYNNVKSQGLSHLQADELTVNFSRPGIVCKDLFWLWIRDIVISPQGYTHTYNPLV